jgi:flagellar basal body P-ring formation chaperone FlgA
MTLQRKRKNVPIVAAVLLAMAVLSAPSHAIRVPRIELLHEVAVSSATVSLSDLLPKGAAEPLRAQSKLISLGAAPQPGTARLIERASILAGIGANRDLLDDIAVPEEVAVTAGARSVTREEVFTAIQSTLREMRFAPANKLSAEDVLFQSQILVREGDAGLEVLRSEFDPGMKCARFLLWPSRDPKVLPFYAAVALPEGFASAGGSRNVAKQVPLLRAFPALAQTASEARPATLVSPGENATLVLRTGLLSMIADVVPLERGSLGQQVRVRVADTGKIFRATVDGRAHLQVKF